MVAPGAELGDRELSTHPRSGAGRSTPPGSKARPLGLAPGNSSPRIAPESCVDKGWGGKGSSTGL